MKNKTVLLLIFMLASSFGFSQKKETGLQIEQVALEYFLDNIQGTPIYYDGFQKFNFDSAKIYVYPETYIKPKLTIRNRTNPKREDFFPITSEDKSGQLLAPDTTRYMLDFTGLRALNASTINIKEVRNPQDLVISLTSRYMFNDHYFVRILINVPIEWKSNEAIIKLDSTGKPLDIRFDYGDI